MRQHHREVERQRRGVRITRLRRPRIMRIRLSRHSRPPHPALHVRDDRDTPLLDRGGTAGISNAVSTKRRSEIFLVEGVDFDLREMRVDLPVGQFAPKGRSEVGMRARPSSRFFRIQFRPRQDHEGKRVADEQYRNINGWNVDSGAEESRVCNLRDALEVGVQ